MDGSVRFGRITTISHITGLGCRMGLSRQDLTGVHPVASAAVIRLARSDWQGNIELGGVLPRREILEGYACPCCWEEILANKHKPQFEKKKEALVIVYGNTGDSNPGVGTVKTQTCMLLAATWRQGRRAEAQGMMQRWACRRVYCEGGEATARLHYKTT